MRLDRHHGARRRRDNLVVVLRYCVCKVGRKVHATPVSGENPHVVIKSSEVFEELVHVHAAEAALLDVWNTRRMTH